jgi:hypothetical protein
VFGQQTMPISFQRTISSLLVAPLGAMVGVGVLSILKGGDGSRPQSLVIYLVITALVCYASELLFVIPLMVFWPRLRQPPALFAAVWGTLVAWGVASLFLGAAFIWPAPNPPPPVASWQSFARLATGLAQVGSFGLLSGLVYSVAARVNFLHLGAVRAGITGSAPSMSVRRMRWLNRRHLTLCGAAVSLAIAAAWAVAESSTGPRAIYFTGDHWEHAAYAPVDHQIDNAARRDSHRLVAPIQ